MYKILMNMSSRTACGYYRAVLPWSQCNKDLLKEGILLEMSENLDTSKYEYDCYIFHRVVSDNIWPFLCNLKGAGKKLVWDLDDNLFSIPEWSSVREMMGYHQHKVLQQCLHWADYISVTTDRFKNQFKDFFPWHSKTKVNPNLLSLDDWDLPKSDFESNQVRFLWAGSTTHSGDLDIVVPAIEQMIEKYRDRVQFTFMGMIPDSLRQTRDSSRERSKLLQRTISFINCCELDYYPQVLRVLAPDVALMPIEDNVFNNAKSNIKYLEMTMSGATCIASNVGPYRDTINHPFDGHLCNNIVSEWFDTMEECYDNSINRKTLIKDLAYSKTVNNYSWDGTGKEVWMNFFRMLAGKEVA